MWCIVYVEGIEFNVLHFRTREQALDYAKFLAACPSVAQVEVYVRAATAATKTVVEFCDGDGEMLWFKNE